MTPSLPRTCSATELRGHFSSQVSNLEPFQIGGAALPVLRYWYFGGAVLRVLRPTAERATGLEPATSSLEGWSSTN